MASGGSTSSGEIKRYNTFVAYADEDIMWARTLIDTLESEPYKLKCADRERDYHPGKTEWTNVQLLFEVSDAFIVILTPSFVSNRWCLEDLDQILAHSRTVESCLVIPLLLRKCQIPFGLQHLRHIEVSPSFTETWMDKLTQALGFIACNICVVEDVRMKATVWCSTSRAALCENCLLLHNQTSDSTPHNHVDMESRRGLDIQKRTLQCLDHQKVVELYCTKCTVALCQTCKVVSHDSCKGIIPLTDAKQYLERSLKDYLGNITAEKEHHIQEKERLENGLHKLKSNFSKEEENIKHKFNSLRELVNKQELDAVGALQESRRANTEKLKKHITSTANILRYSEQKSVSITEALTAASEIDMCQVDMDIKTSGANTHTPMSEHEISKLTDIAKAIDVKEIVDSFQTLNCPTNATVEGEEQKTVQEDSPTLLRTIAASTVPSSVADICILHLNGKPIVVVTDPKNKMVRSFFLDERGVSSSEKFIGDPPRAVTKFTEDQVAVSVLGSATIVILHVSPEISVRNVIECSWEFQALALLEIDKFIGGVVAGTMFGVNKVTIKGNYFIHMSPYGANYYSFPGYAHVSSDGLVLVSDSERKRVVCLSETRGLQFKFPLLNDGSLRSPRAVTTSPAGDVFVADHDQNAVIKLTASGQFVAQVLTENELCAPCAICFDQEGKLYVGQENGEIKVYQLP